MTNDPFFLLALFARAYTGKEGDPLANLSSNDFHAQEAGDSGASECLYDGAAAGDWIVSSTKTFSSKALQKTLQGLPPLQHNRDPSMDPGTGKRS